MIPSKMRNWFFLVLVVLGLLPVAAAQDTDTPLLAFLNSSGQLVVASADGVTRWIVSNPGETIHPALGFSWSADGDLLFYAVQEDEDRVSLRIGDAATQSSAEVGSAVEPVSGGEWVGNFVRVVDATTDALYSLQGISQQREANAELLSPYALGDAHLAGVSSFSEASNAIFAWQNGGYGLLVDGNFRGLGIFNNRRSVRSGLWATSEPLVAYWGTVSETGASTLAVTNAETGAVALLSGNSSTPLQPILWLADNTVLIFRDASSQLRAADLACLLSSCALNPLEASVAFLPPSANDVQQIADGRVIFHEGENLLAIDPACIAEDTCLENMIVLAQQVAPRTFVDAVESRIAFTAYQNSATDPTDRRAVVLDADCPPEDNCVPFSVPNARAGFLSTDERYLVADVLDDGLYIVSVEDGSRVYLTGSSQGNDLLQTTRWNG